jgi:hypothetical protein
MTNANLGTITSVSKDKNTCVVNYSSGARVTYYSCMDDVKESMRKNGTLTVTKNSNPVVKPANTHSSGYAHSNWNYSGGGSHSTTSYYQSEMKEAFKSGGIQFFGGPKTSLDKVDFSPDGRDIIINCTGTEWVPKKFEQKRFVSKHPSWLPNDMLALSPPPQNKNGDKAHQIVFDWQDFGIPPLTLDIGYWINLLKLIRREKINRVYCCCTAGQGRTGTLLSSLLLAEGIVEEPDDAIKYIRQNYNSKAVENKTQENYIFNLIYEEVKS